MSLRIDSTSNRNDYQEHLLGDEGWLCVGLTTIPRSCADLRKFWDHVQACTLIALPSRYSSIARYVCHMERQIGNFARICTFYHIINILRINRTYMFV